MYLASIIEVDHVKYMCSFFFQAEDGIRDLVRSRGLGDVYKRQAHIGSKNKATIIARMQGGQPRPNAIRLAATRIEGLSLIHI